MIDIYTDGACQGNPGPGGWGVVVRLPDGERELSGREALTTNNRMELMAAISGLEALPGPSKVSLTTDSQYVKNGITSWITGWKRKGWRTASGEPVKNRDLWERLDALAGLHDVDWRWVKGHAGHPLNERCDRLAVAAIRGVAAAPAPAAAPARKPDAAALLAHCQAFIAAQAIDSRESVHRADRVRENALAFIEGVCEIVGYAPPGRDAGSR